MKDWFKKISPFVLLVAAVAVFVSVILMKDRLSETICTALCAFGGVLLGFGVTGLVLSDKHMTPEEKKDLERGERDERNVAIREKAAMSTWYWTLYLLWGLFLVFMVMDGYVYAALLSLALACHSVFYLVNIRRWARKM